MNKSEATALFREEYLPFIAEDDEIQLREEWNNFTDALCKNGDITEFQYDTWTNPFLKE